MYVREREKDSHVSGLQHHVQNALVQGLVFKLNPKPSGLRHHVQNASVQGLVLKLNPKPSGLQHHVQNAFVFLLMNPFFIYFFIYIIYLFQLV